MRVSLSLVGNYMCKNPPVILFDITGLHSDKDLIKKYIFNTPADIQRNFQGQLVKLNGSQTIMYTKFSHDVITGLVNLVLKLYDNQKRSKFLKFKFYGTEKHYNYFQMAKFHLGEKVFGISYCTWMKEKLYRLGIVDDQLYQEILNSDKFSYFIWRINWKLEKEEKEKINNSCENLRNESRYYEDEYAIINPFFQKNPSIERQEYYNSVTHFVCIFKNDIQNAALIITYQSVEQLKKIISRTDNVEGINNNMGLLDFIEASLKPNNRKLSAIVHVVQNHELLNSAQLYQLYGILDNLCYSLNKDNQIIKAKHLFYGYGIKSSTTNIHHLLNTYYKGIRFYSISSKLFKFIPNITLNHFSFWNKLFQKEFIDIVERIEKNKENKKKSFIEVYKPIHRMNVCQNEAIQQQGLYSVSSQIISSLKYPLFSTAIEYRPTQQLNKLYQKKTAFEGYTSRKSKNNKLFPIDNKFKLLKEFDPKIIFLGTNSKTPSQFRNVSGILLQLPKYSNSQTLILLDCGSGTYEQLLYHYTPEQLPQKFIDLKIILMTHLHADHNLGILDLINQRNKLIKQKGMDLSQNKLFIILPFNMFGWIENYCKAVTNILEGCEVLFIQTLTGQKINIRDDFFQRKRCEVNLQRLKLTPGKMFGSKELSGPKANTQGLYDQDYYNKYIKRDGSLEDYVHVFSQENDYFVISLIQKYGYKQQFVKAEFDLLLQKHKIKKFLPSKVFHCPFSYGIIIEYKNGVKISYSGDCRPTPEFLEQAKGSTLLIHEATFESNCQSKAESKLHSTFHEAIEAGLTSKSHNICLTHFTLGAFDRDLAQTCHHSLYKPEVLNYYKKKAIIACDHLEFNLSEADDLVKVSKIISHIGTNNITEKNPNPFSVKSQILQVLKSAQQKKENQNIDIEKEYFN